MVLDTSSLYLKLKEDFSDFCAEKQVSRKKIPEILEQVVNDLAKDFGFQIKIEKNIPAGIEVLFGERIPKSGEPLVVV